MMDELFEAYNSGEPEMEADEWRDKRDKKRKQEKEKKTTKKSETSPVEKPSTPPTEVPSTSSEPIKEPLLVTTVSKIF